MNFRWLVIALVTALGVACSDPTDATILQLNLDRPVDIAFACYGNMTITSDPNKPIQRTAQPAKLCEIRSPLVAPDDLSKLPIPDDQKGEAIGTPNWYGFILQSASGTVALSTWLAKPSYDPHGVSEFKGGDVGVIDADPLTPGKNAISIGEEPIAIATDTSGCYEVTANAGSCDLSVLEINSAVAHSAAGSNSTAPVRIERRMVTSGAGPILAKPAAMVAEPNTEDIGNVCPMTAAGVVYIAYPSCHLVAGVDASSGRIVSGIKYENGVPRVLDPATELGTTLTCPQECADPGDPGKPGEGSVTPGVRPVTLALEVVPDLSSGSSAVKTQLVIGADNAASVTVVDLDRAMSPTKLQPPRQFALEDKTGKLGVSAVALSPQIPMGNPPAKMTDPPPGGWGQYVYAVANDNTVRVIDVLTVNKECDTQVDTRLVRAIPDVSKLQCFPVGDAATPRRRVGARGPGIELVGDAVPTSVAILHALDAPLRAIDPVTNVDGQAPPITPSTLIGYFAIITTTTGRTFVVNIDDDFAPDRFDRNDPQKTMPTLVMAHQLRDSFANRGAVAQTIATPPEPLCRVSDPNATQGGLGAGGPRAASAPVASLIGGLVSTAKASQLPALRQFECHGNDTLGTDGKTQESVAISEVQFGAPVKYVKPMAPPATSENIRDQVFPDLRSLVNDEIWSLTWEGTLSQDTSLTAVDGPVVRTGQMSVKADGVHLTDAARPFCAAGVEPFDIVNFRGCNPMNGDTDCPAGYQCFVHPDSKLAIGSCMLKTEASRLANACRDFLISFRHYAVKLAKSGELLLMPRRHALRTTPLEGCTSDLQCRDLADYAAQSGNAGLPALRPNSMDPNSHLDPHTWACMADDTHAPLDADPSKSMRCIETCGYYADPKKRDDDCIDGPIKGMICQGATPPSPGNPAGGRGVCMESITPPQACVNAPQRFDVRASEAFTVVGTRSGYIHPIVDLGGTDHTCGRDPLASPLQLGRIPLKAPACDPADPITVLSPNPCSLTVQHAENQQMTPSCTVNKFGLRDNAPAIRFRNPGMMLTLVDPFYEGDQVCVGDRKGVIIDGQPSTSTTSPLHIPLVFPGYALSFEQKAGFSPLTLPPAVNAVFPVKVVRGPTSSIWVLDAGDFLSNSAEPSTRGRVYRIEASQLQLINTLN